jgi:uncharacterized phage-associated protein
MTSPNVFAQAILERTCEKDISVSHLKLQKLMYYCQGYHLALHDETAFDSKVCAWKHGPVITALYAEYNMYGSSDIPQKEIKNIFSELTASAQEVIDFVLNKYGHMGAWALRQQTHREQPWLTHYDRPTNTVDNQEITSEEMKSYFEDQMITNQDIAFAKLLDAAAENDDGILVPDDIKDADDFINWINAN